MQRPANILFRIVTGLAGLAIVLAVVFLIVNSSHVATAQDTRVSDQIRSEFEQVIRTDITADSRPTVTSSPRRNGTFIIVAGGALTEKEKENMAVQAKEIARKHNNREVTIVFRDQR
jgi:hypothetical protein